MKPMQHLAATVVLSMLPAVAATAQEQVPRFELGKSPEFAGMLQQASQQHVGDTLPNGIRVSLPDGSPADLRALLDGPVILFKLNSAAVETSGYVHLFGAIREAGDRSLGKKSARVAVLFIGSDDARAGSVDLPPSVMVLHTASFMQDGFLGGHLTPVTFYFDRDLKLVKRRPGLPFKARMLLDFPAGS